MTGKKKFIIDAFNEQLGAIKAEAAKPDSGQTFVTLVLFGVGREGGIEVAYDKVPAEKVPELNEETYQTVGNTPMRDGIGTLLTKLLPRDDSSPDADVSFLVWTFTDGLENASKEWSSAGLKTLTDTLEARDNWNFSIVGANQDVLKTSAEYGMSASNALSFNMDAESIGAMAKNTTRGVENYFSSRRQGVKKLNNLYAEDTKTEK
jgi:hypothetical protein